MIVALVFLLGAGGEAVQKVVRAEEFRLVGRDGKTRAMLDLVGNEPGLVLIDQNDSVRAMLNLADSGRPGLSLWDQDGKTHAMLGQTYLMLNDQNDTTRAELHLADSGQPGLGLIDQNGTTRVELVLTKPDGQPRFALADQDGKVIWSKP
jgi:hypothetical protein